MKLKKRIEHFIRPRTLISLSYVSFPVLLLIAFMTLSWGVYYALIQSPTDYQHGDYVRLMYVHVPTAWLSLGIYGLMGVSAFLSLWLKIPLFYYLPKASASIGTVFTGLCLITGALWGKVAWGTYWVWDARLTSMFILFLIYCGYLLMLYAFKEEDEGLKFGHYLLVVGLINLPIIKFSVNWWFTLHQPASIMKFSASSIHPSMLMPLGLMVMGFLCFYGAFASLNLRRLMMLAKVRRREELDVSALKYSYVLRERSASDG